MTIESRSRVARGGLACVTIMLLALVAVLTLPGGSAVAADRWSDISDQRWLEVYGVTADEAATVAEGYPGGLFRPANPVTRGQFAKMVVAGFDLLPIYLPSPTFRDVPSTHFYFEWVEGAVQAEIVSGYGDGTFRPGQSIQRQEANTILGRWLSAQELARRGGIEGSKGSYLTLTSWFISEGSAVLPPFGDDQFITPAHRAATAYLVAREVLRGETSGSLRYLRPLNDLARAQAVALILRAEKAALGMAPG